MASKPKLEVVPTAIRPCDVINRLNDIREAVATHIGIPEHEVAVHLSGDGKAIAFEFRLRKHEEATEAQYKLASLPGFTVSTVSTGVPPTGFGHIVRGRIGG